MKVWAILGARRGDNNQVLALAESLGLPYEIKRLRYNCLRLLGPRILGASLLSLTRHSRALVLHGQPDLTISTGHRSVPVVQALRKRSKGRMRSVHLNYPRISPANFDLVVATPEYPIEDHPNLLRIPFCLTRAGNPAEADHEFWRVPPKPRRLLILGGPTLYWRLGRETVRRSLNALVAASEIDGGSVLVVGSPRTPSDMLSDVRKRLARVNVQAILCPMDGPPSYRALLRNADTITITADSVAMISEAIASEKPVSLLPIEPTVAGRIAMALWDWMRPGRRLHPRDLRFFWRAIGQQGFAGSMQEPRHGSVPNINSLVAARVRTVLKIDDS